MKKIFPYLIISALTLITVNLWLLSKSDYSLVFKQPFLSLGQLLSLIGICYISLTILLTSKSKTIEKIFGGLDQVYYIHQILGSISFIFLINHPLMFAFQSLPNYKIALIYLIPSIDIAYNLGILAFYIMILAFIFTIFIKLPYHIWKLTHKFLGVSFLLGSIHALLIPSDVSSYLPLRLWITGFIALGLFSVVYTIFLYRHFGPRFLYRVQKIERTLDVVNVFLVPLTKRVLKFSPGQFIYSRFENKILGNELHPFSISSSPYVPFIRISAKAIGDYTLKLSFLNQEDKAYIYGPYGEFGKSDNRYESSQVWIAGGIGITPFLSMLYQKASGQKKHNITLFYCYRTKEEGVFLNEINEIVRQNTLIKLIDWCSREKKRLTADIINGKIDLDKTEKILICGPEKMMTDLKNQFVMLGQPETKILFENFSFLT